MITINRGAVGIASRGAPIGAASLAAVAQGLVNMENGHLIFGDAVSRVADSLSPFGAASRIVAQSCALIVDMRELQLQARTIDSDKELRLVELADRRRKSTEVLRQMRSQLGHVDVSAEALRQMLRFAQREIVKQHLRHEDRVIYLEIIQTYGQHLVAHTDASWDGLVRGLDGVLNGAGSIEAGPARNARQPRPQPARRSRQSRR